MIRWAIDRERWPLTAGLVGPLALIVVVRVVLVTDGPMAADATPIEPLPPIPAVGSGAWVSADQKQAAAYARELVQRPFGKSPMYYPSEYDQGATALVPAPLPDPPIEYLGQPVPNFAVTSVMAGSRGSLAMVDGAWRRVGDEVQPGWVLSEIDGRSGTVRFLGSRGRAVEVRVRADNHN